MHVFYRYRYSLKWVYCKSCQVKFYSGTNGEQHVTFFSESQTIKPVQKFYRTSAMPGNITYCEAMQML